MIEIDMRHLVPDFILADKNGAAMAKAMEAAFSVFAETIQDGIDTALNIDLMPEWRLDEMAWELNCLYDYTATVDEKRAWIKSAASNYEKYGTPSAIISYLSGVFGYVTVEENWKYGGQPYHFRVNVNDDLTPEKEAWARRAIQKVKNVRSVLDGVALNLSATVGITPETSYTAFNYIYPGSSLYCGQIYDTVDPH